MELFIEEWEWDERNIEHLAKHDITPELIEDGIWSERPLFIRNKPDRAATHLMIGPDRGGAFWTICIRQVGDEPGLWRAITGWRSVPREVQWYHKHSRHQ